MVRICLVLLVSILPAALNAQAAGERLLIPVTLSQPLPGAYGSLWSTELVARNMGSTAVQVRHIAPLCNFPCAPEAEVPPNETVVLLPGIIGTDRNAAIIEASPANDLAFHLRVQDLSRQAETWGTEVPVVREHELRTSTLALVNVPVGEGFRNTLRIYEIDGTPDAEVLVRLYGIRPGPVGMFVSPRPDQLLGERRLRLVPPLPFQRERSPAYLELGDLGQIAPLGASERVVVQIEPVSPGMRFWAFVSVTNNTTQHVTVITPQ